MNSRTLPIAAAVLFVAAVISATNAHAQAAQPAPQPQTPAPASAPPPAQDSTAPPATPQPPAKKVWSNEDMKGLDPHAGVSTVGKDDKPAKPGEKPAANGQTHSAEYYKNKITKLQSQIPPLDAQIAELQSAIDGKPTGDAIKSTRPAGVKFDNWTNELADLQAKRADLLAQITALQDEARHDGIPAKDIP